MAMGLGKPKKKPWDIKELIPYGYIAEITTIIMAIILSCLLPHSSPDFTKLVRS